MKQATLAITTPAGQQHTVPLMQAMDPHGRPAPLVHDTLAANCDHAGQTWSQDFDLHCTRCGSPMFLPASRLARIDGRSIWRMYLLWHAAGWPQWWNSAWDGDAPRAAHPYFVAFGGIPVEPERREAFDDLAASFVRADMETPL